MNNNILNAKTFFEAIERRNYNSVKTYIDEYEDVINMVDEKTGDTPLHAAIKAKSTELIQLLLENGADRWVINNDGENAFQVADRLCRACFDVLDEFDFTEEQLKEREAKKAALLEKAATEKYLKQQREQPGINRYLLNKLNEQPLKEGGKRRKTHKRRKATKKSKKTRKH